MSPGFALQQALFAALAADSTVTALIANRLYDGVPESAAMPYVVLGEADETAADAATETALRHHLVFHIWSRGGGTRESKQIASAIRDCLAHAALTLPGHVLIDLRFVAGEYRRQSDGKTYRAVLRFTALTETQEL